MTTYVYQTIPEDDHEEPEYFEVKQSMKDEPLTNHPETGVLVKRVILGGYSPKLRSGGDSSPGSSCCSGGPCCS